MYIYITIEYIHIYNHTSKKHIIRRIEEEEWLRSNNNTAVGTKNQHWSSGVSTVTITIIIIGIAHRIQSKERSQVKVFI